MLFSPNFYDTVVIFLKKSPQNHHTEYRYIILIQAPGKHTKTSHACILKL